MARTWWSIQVELVSGRGEHCWPRPGRVLIAHPGWTFATLATAIDDAFGRWDLAHLHEFVLADGTRLAPPDPWGEDDALDDAGVHLSVLSPGEMFAYTFDLGDGWEHLCTVAAQKVDPMEVAGVVPDRPIPIDGWGDLPDQYRRRFAGDDGVDPVPPQPDPPTGDLAPLHPHWGAAGDPPAVDDLVVLRALAAPGLVEWDDTSLPALRSAVHRGDLDAVMVLLADHDATEVAHIAAPALLALGRRGLVLPLILGVVEDLGQRGWPGDAELAAELAAAVGEGPEPASQPITVDLPMLADQLENRGADPSWYLDLSAEGWMTDEPMAWISEVADGLEDDERYLPITPHLENEGWHDMALFIQTLRARDGALAERLERAIRGSGASRGFGFVLHPHEKEWQRWRRFSEERRLGRARQWLEIRDRRPAG